MYNRTDVIYIYDGTFYGFLSCVYLYYYSRFNPVDIVQENNLQPSLYQNVTVSTDIEKAKKVLKAIEHKISKRTVRFLKECFLSYQKGKEIHMLKFIVKGFEYGDKINALFSDEDVDFLIKSYKHLKREAHLYLGITRFYTVEDVFIAQIKPKNQILPLVSKHFVERFCSQQFMIYDLTNSQALIYNAKTAEIVSVSKIELPTIGDDEIDVQKLWRTFYDTIAIKERYNPKCRMSFLPKRTWDNLPELKDET